MSESEAIQNMFIAGSLTAFILSLILILSVRKDEFNWKNGSNSFWWSGNNLEMMVTRWHNTPPEKQQEYILRLNQLVTVGSAVLVLSFAYPFLPSLTRVLALPLTLISAWFIGSYLGRRK